MLKRCNVVMLPTNKKSKITLSFKERSFNQLIEPKLTLIKESNYQLSNIQSHHLYIISDDEIKENGTHFYNPHSGQLHISGNHTDYKAVNNNGCKKIIATTDTLLKIEINGNRGNLLPDVSFDINLPQPSQQFIQKYIEEYNKGHIITDVLVEYEYLLDDRAVLPYWNLKINTKDNTITIKKLKETYTKEELSQILENFTSFLWSEVGIHYPISLGNDAKDKFINHEL